MTEESLFEGAAHCCRPLPRVENRQLVRTTRGVTSDDHPEETAQGERRPEGDQACACGDDTAGAEGEKAHSNHRDSFTMDYRQSFRNIRVGVRKKSAFFGDQAL